jgi:hypothetical protein
MATKPREIDGATCGIRYIARGTGTQNYGKKRLVDYVAALCQEHGLPAPYPLHVKGQGTTLQVREDSRWNLAAVDLWLDDWGLPPANAAALERRRAAEAGEIMDGRAKQLSLVVIDGGAI